MNNEDEKINIVILVLTEKLFEKCPFLMFDKLVLPFAEYCVRQIDDPNKFFKVKKVLPDLDMLYNIIKLYDENKILNSYFETNIKFNSYNTLNHYIKNDIDFYYYYLNERQDQENYNYYNDNKEESNLDEENKSNNNDNLNELNIEQEIKKENQDSDQKRLNNIQKTPKNLKYIVGINNNYSDMSKI